MTVATRTFSIALSSTAPTTVTELVHFRDEPLLAGEKAAVYLEACFCNVSLKSFQLMRFPNYEGDESDAERLSLFTAAELASQKIGLRIVSRKNNTGNWREKAEVILTNAGRKSYFDLLIPYLAKAQVRLLEYNDALGIQLIDYGNGLLKLSDFIEIEFAVTVDVSKKNDVEELNNRISALESLLSVFGGSSATLPGSNGLVPAPPANSSNSLLRADRTWQNSNTFVPASSSGIYGGAEIPTTAKGGWSGIFFAGGGDKNYLMQNPINGDIGLYNSAAVRWNFFANDTAAAIGLPLSINNTAIIKKVQFLSTIVSLPNIASNSLFQVDIAFAGVNVGHFVMVSPTNNPVTNGFWTFYCHAQILSPNVVTIFFKNDWTSALDLPDFWIRIMYIEVA